MLGGEISLQGQRVDCDRGRLRRLSPHRYGISLGTTSDWKSCIAERETQWLRAEPLVPYDRGSRVEPPGSDLRV